MIAVTEKRRAECQRISDRLFRAIDDMLMTATALGSRIIELAAARDELSRFIEDTNRTEEPARAQEERKET